MIFKDKVHGNQSGQALLIIVLIMVIVLTVGLSIVTRTITNLRTTTEQANSQKALSAAEAGIEQALKRGTTGILTDGFGTGVNVPKYTASYMPVDATRPFLANGGNILSKDDGVYVWVTPNAPNFSDQWNGSLYIYWGLETDGCKSAALEIAVITGPVASPTTKRIAVDPCNARTTSNNFTYVGPGSYPPIEGKNFRHRIQVSETQGRLIRVVPLYVSAYVGVQRVSGTTLPSQGSIVTSKGTSQDTNRTIQVYQSLPELPTELFPYSLFWPL